MTKRELYYTRKITEFKERAEASRKAYRRLRRNNPTAAWLASERAEYLTRQVQRYTQKLKAA